MFQALKNLVNNVASEVAGGGSHQTSFEKPATAPATLSPEDEQLEVRQKAEIVQETIKPVTIEHVQPVIDVHREQTEIHQVMQPVHVREEMPVQVHKTVEPTAFRETIADVP